MRNTRKENKNVDKKIRFKTSDKIHELKKSWRTFISLTKTEGKETKEAIKILYKLLKGGEITEEEKDLLKHQSVDLARIVTVMSLGAVSMVIPLALEKILNKYGISIMPSEHKSNDKK
jgi:hypothetical protein